MSKKYIDQLQALESELQALREQNDNSAVAIQMREIEEEINIIRSKAGVDISAWDRVKLARLPERPTALDYMDLLFRDFIELHGDRHYADDKAIIGGIATIDDFPVTVIAQQKGRSTAENIERNFGMPNPEGYRKALRLMKQAEKFGRPVICFVDTQGAYPGLGAEERGQGEAIARILMESSNLKVPIISILIGEGGSGGALALAVADRVVMLENAIYSILSPEGFASILWKDAGRAQEAAEKMKITAKEIKEFSLIDAVIKEPAGGAQYDIDIVVKAIRRYLLNQLPELMKKKDTQLVRERYNKFRQMGVFRYSLENKRTSEEE
ncbi:acetyl-CoA carboxylase carboxyltransferase subunit alpha [Culicoidibacter larvae]|uniref:Acetyl-coenzyme A carboxylase carboxyl transferase subunit alpha n=1 Tax=Culicoidibacter larvae TaxID=2579976 RepID=A0A5R8QGC8_9FIRM|nr:acetyl-CoA carboxylase carboxyltransferase subunit alpha [Culicoidibacter larvae]TLG77065.1 acetyl-CoA carboxylase carboxyltransferase subunit alpha [Culicoidibacter larvae]